MKNCTVCGAPLTADEPPILIMNAYGEPKCLCDSCSSDLDEITSGGDLDSIGRAMEELGKRMSDYGPDKLTYNTVNRLMKEGAERAKAIREGNYDFSLDGEEADDAEGFDEIPEELAETEEDKELDRIDEEKAAKVGKFLDWVTIGLIIGAVGFFIWVLIDRFFLN